MENSNMAITHYVINELADCHSLCVEAVKVGRVAGGSMNTRSIAKAYVAHKQQRIAECISFYRLSVREYDDAKIRRKLSEIRRSLTTP